MEEPTGWEWGCPKWYGTPPPRQATAGVRDVGALHNVQTHIHAHGDSHTNPFERDRESCENGKKKTKRAAEKHVRGKRTGHATRKSGGGKGGGGRVCAPEHASRSALCSCVPLSKRYSARARRCPRHLLPPPPPSPSASSSPSSTNRRSHRHARKRDRRTALPSIAYGRAPFAPVRVHQQRGGRLLSPSYPSDGGGGGGIAPRDGPAGMSTGARRCTPAEGAICGCDPCACDEDGGACW